MGTKQTTTMTKFSNKMEQSYQILLKEFSKMQ